MAGSGILLVEDQPADINMPRMDGWEVLSEIREDPELKTIPVIVFTTSDSKPDVDKAYAMGANAYVTKPLHFEGLLKSVVKIEGFWLCLVKLP